VLLVCCRYVGELLVCYVCVVGMLVGCWCVIGVLSVVLFVCCRYVGRLLVCYWCVAGMLLSCRCIGALLVCMLVNCQCVTGVLLVLVSLKNTMCFGSFGFIEKCHKALWQLLNIQNRLWQNIFATTPSVHLWVLTTRSGNFLHENLHKMHCGHLKRSISKFCVYA